jgi:hypothetical protein
MLKKLPVIIVLTLFIVLLQTDVSRAAINCRFSTRSGTLTFGLLDPGNPVDRSANISLNIRCNGSDPSAQVMLSTNDGLYPVGPGLPRMRHTLLLTEYLPYTLSFNPPSGTTIPRNTNVTLTITATIVGLDYQNASSGDYEDIIDVYINP